MKPARKYKITWQRSTLLPVLVLLVLAVWQVFYQGENLSPEFSKTDTGVVEAAHAARRSGVWVETSGQVARLLSDDNEGSRHQRFILELESGHTVLVAHNIDLAERVPLSRDETVRLRGRYEWNDRGGVIHWTHHDPQGREAGGWVAYRGKNYH